MISARTHQTIGAGMAILLVAALSPATSVGDEIEARIAYTMAEKAYQDKNYVQAEAKCREAIEQLGSSNPRIHYLLVRSLAGQGKHADVDREAKVYFSFQPDSASPEFNDILNLVAEARGIVEKQEIERKEREKKEQEQKQRELEEAEKRNKEAEVRKAREEKLRAAKEKRYREMCEFYYNLLPRTTHPGERAVLTLAPDVTMAFRWCPYPADSLQAKSGKSGFWMGETEVTQKQYKALFPDATFRTPNDSFPATSISQDEALRFSKMANAVFGFESFGQSLVRLPDRDHWEIAAQCGKEKLPYFSKDSAEKHFQVLRGYENLFDLSAPTPRDDDPKKPRIRWPWNDGFPDLAPAPVASFKPNAWGIHDLYGNVAEWSSYQGSKDAQVQRTALGGSYFSDQSRRSHVEGYRFDKRTLSYGFVGFRLFLLGAPPDEKDYGQNFPLFFPYRRPRQDHFVIVYDPSAGPLASSGKVDLWSKRNSGNVSYNDKQFYHSEQGTARNARGLWEFKQWIGNDYNRVQWEFRDENGNRDTIPTVFTW